MNAAKEAKFISFAIHTFRDVADGDYIAARMAFRAGLLPQFLWAGQQAIEKYLKCILLLNRIEAKDVKHDLHVALQKLEAAPFKLHLSDSSMAMLKLLDKSGRYRYFEYSLHISGVAINQLDSLVWEIRRYCVPASGERILAGGIRLNLLDLLADRIAASQKRPPKQFTIVGGTLEGIIANREHPAYAPLVWSNESFGVATSSEPRVIRKTLIANSPLSLNPGILDEVLKYVYIPKAVADAYRKAANDKLRNDRAGSAE